MDKCLKHFVQYINCLVEECQEQNIRLLESIRLFVYMRVISEADLMMDNKC